MDPKRICKLFSLLLGVTVSAGAGTSLRNSSGALPRPARIAASLNGAFACMAADDGTVHCWGSNQDGQLGTGKVTNNESLPVQAQGIYMAVSVAVGQYHSCALRSDGIVFCWGNSSFGQVGNGSTDYFVLAPVAVSGLSGITAIAAGDTFTCGLRFDGTVWCWGDYPASTARPSQVSLSQAKAISAGSGHACALMVDGTVQCWGNNSFGQLGDGAVKSRVYPQPVSGLSGVTAVTAGTLHSCALLADSSVWCWGSGDGGALGNGGTSDQHLPVSAGAGFTAIGAGSAFTCAIKANGAGSCWGNNDVGQLGIGTLGGTVLTPSNNVTGLSNAVEIVGGSLGGLGFGCAMDVTGVVRCWGYNPDGQLGNGTTQTEPFAVTTAAPRGSIGARYLATAGASFFTCAARGTGAVACWGASAGGLGDGINPTSSSAVAVAASGGYNNNAKSVSANSNHACLALASGTAACWGKNAYGEIGDGSFADRSTPVGVTGIATTAAIASGVNHSCALLADGQVKCWGRNNLGQLGDGLAEPVSPSPVTANLSQVIALAAGSNHTCALRADGGVLCWGDNSFGQIGNGSTGGPVGKPVTVMSGVTAVSAGDAHTCVLQAGGTVACWGKNTSGQLGNGTTQPRPTPDIAISVTQATAVSAGLSHTCITTAQGEAACWGDNSYSQLATKDNSSPYLTAATVIQKFVLVQSVEIPIPLTYATNITAGAGHTCALIASGLPQCWGNNVLGQAGDGNFFSPVPRPNPVNSFTANVDLEATYDSSGRIAAVTALINCPLGGEAHISLTLGQSQASGTGKVVEACAGGLVRVPMRIPAQGPQAFQTGPATASVEAVVKVDGAVTEDQHWTRALVLTPAK